MAVAERALQWGREEQVRSEGCRDAEERLRSCCDDNIVCGYVCLCTGGVNKR